MSIPKQTATMLPLAQLTPHPNNVRKSLGDVSELAASIRQNGLIQPIVVTQHPKQTGQWLILAGHKDHVLAEHAGRESEDELEWDDGTTHSLAKVNPDGSMEAALIGAQLPRWWVDR